MELDAALIDRLRQARLVVILTGAGASAESGIPTFRDRQTGLWQKFDAMELATPGAFQADPSLVWGWYEWRRAAVLRAQPNAAHVAIAEMAERVPHLTLITQNVDDLHERAGSKAVLHLHGELALPYCGGCRRRHVFPAVSASTMTPAEGARIDPPRCQACGALIRPGVVWFGEPLPRAVWQSARDAAGRADVFFCIGTSSMVQPAASLTELAIDAGAATVLINPNPTAMDDKVAFAYRETAATILPQLLSATWPRLA